MRKIIVVDYQSRWPSEFVELATELRGACSAWPGLNEQILRIDHIGSTAVPGLAAKDVIDIQISVADLQQPQSVAGLIRAISAISYEHVPNMQDNLVGVDDSSLELRKLYFREANSRRPTHIHVRQPGRLNQEYALLFRDFLRADELVKSAYQQVKQALALRFRDDVSSYYAIKDPYMDTVYRAAQMWKQACGWVPDDAYL